MFTIYNKL